MRFRVTAWLPLLTACGSAATSRQPPSPPPASASQHSCADAALGLENATRGVRSPDHPVSDALRTRCAHETWPASAIDCYATMTEGDLGRCSRLMPAHMRDAVFEILAGVDSSPAGLAIARARLDQLQVGVPECDRFITAVATMLSCEAMPIETRVQLGNETASVWSLPTARLGTDDLRRIAKVCGDSLATLQQQALQVGCML